MNLCLEKSVTLIGNDKNIHNIGLIPLSIYVLFKLWNLNDQKENNRISIKVSIVELISYEDKFKDILSSYTGCK